jgi:hypothetical protein
MKIHTICIWSFLALLAKERLGYQVQGSLSINFSLLSCQNKEFGNKYFLFFYHKLTFVQKTRGF